MGVGLRWSLGLPYSSVGKESACNAGDPGLTPGLGRSAGEELGYPLQYSWASLMAQTVKNLPVQETGVWSLHWEDPLEEGMATCFSILARRILMDRGGWWTTVHEVAGSDTTEGLSMRCMQGKQLSVLCLKTLARVFFMLVNVWL